MKSTGHISKRIDDADFLIAHERYEAALLLLLTAIDGSANKVFPRGEPSIDEPKRKYGMTNKERYQRFLGVRLRQEMGFELDEESYRIKNLSSLPRFRDGQESPEKTIYEVFRNNDVHESRIPEQYHNFYSEQGVSNRIGLEVSGDEVNFSSGFLTLLRKVVVNAPCNGVEFGIRHIKLYPKNDEIFSDFIDKLSNDFSIGSGRIEALIKLIEATDPDIDILTDSQLAGILTYTMKRRYPALEGALSMILKENPICALGEGFTEYGARICREIVYKSKVVNISS